MRKPTDSEKPAPREPSSEDPGPPVEAEDDAIADLDAYIDQVSRLIQRPDDPPPQTSGTPGECPADEESCGDKEP